MHLGFTATPNRADKNYLGNIYDKILVDKNIKWGIQNNYLTDIECYKINIGYDLSKVTTRMGDFANNELASAIDIRQCNQAIADIYKEYAVGQTLIFAASVSHAENIAKLIPGSAVITHNTDNRAQILDDFTNKKIKCIVNNLILTEGTDLPCVETIIFCRPTQNISLYTQCIGRGTRLYPNKEKLRLIDCVGLSEKNICTAPMLFGIDPKIAEKTEQDEGLLSDMEQRIEEVQNNWLFDEHFWKYNAELINLFSKDGLYDLHGINFVVMGNRDLICSLGESQLLRLTAEDALGNTKIIITQKDVVLFTKEDMQMQDALDYVHDMLLANYQRHQSLWDRASVEKWGNSPASEKQIALIRKIYRSAELRSMKVKMNELTKYQASILINRKLAE